MFKDLMKFALTIISELLTLFRLNRESKNKEVEIKNQEDFRTREKKQQEVSIKDSDEKLIADVIHAKTEEEKKKKLDEIRKIIAK